MVRNQVKVQVRYEVMTQETRWVDHTQTHSNYIRSKPIRPVSVENIQPNKLVVTIV